MSPSRLDALKGLQRIRFERSGQALESRRQEVANLRKEIAELRTPAKLDELASAGGAVLEKHLDWRNRKLIALNMELARKLADLEGVRAACQKEFGRKLALDKLCKR